MDDTRNVSRAPQQPRVYSRTWAHLYLSMSTLFPIKIVGKSCDEDDDAKR